MTVSVTVLTVRMRFSAARIWAVAPAVMTEVFTAIRSGAIAPTIALMAVMKRIAAVTSEINVILVTVEKLVSRVTNNAMDLSNVKMAMTKHVTSQVYEIFKLANGSKPSTYPW